MSNDKLPSDLITLLNCFRNIAKSNYNGKIYDNVLNIFEEMDIDDKKNLLRGLFNIYTISTTRLAFSPDICDLHAIPNKIDDKMTPIAPVVPKNDETLDEKLKYFILRGFISALIILTLVIVYSGFHGDPDTTKNFEFLAGIGKVVTFMFK